MAARVRSRRFMIGYLLDDIYALRRFDGGNDWSHFMKVCNGIEGLTARWLGASTAHFRAVSS